MNSSETVFRTFLEAPAEASQELAPLTHFMIHVWRRHGLENGAALERPPEREKFVYWFYDTFHRVRAPYRWPVPAHTLRWLNEPALDLSARQGEKHYLTRFMLHVWKHFRQDM